MIKILFVFFLLLVLITIFGTLGFIVSIKKFSKIMEETPNDRCF